MEMSLLKKTRVAVLFGGMSSEHAVSLISAASVIQNIPKEQFEVVMLGITRDGEWKLYCGDADKIKDSGWERDAKNLPAFLSPDSQIHGIVAIHPDGKAETIRVDVVFPVLHGLYGEDGTIQGLLSLARIPFVGCGVSASAVCMDKALAKAICDAYQIPQAKWDSIRVNELKDNTPAIVDHLEAHLGYPMFVKPANAGSSVGISKAKDRKALYKAIETASVQDTKIVFEESIDGREVECAVLGNSDPVASCCGEIKPCNEFYDYSAKYLAGKTELDIPAKLPKEISEKVRALAVKAFRLFGCKGMTRMDFFVLADGTVYLNEPNTIPGFTSISMYPKLFEAGGTAYGELLATLLRLAMER